MPHTYTQEDHIRFSALTEKQVAFIKLRKTIETNNKKIKEKLEKFPIHGADGSMFGELIKYFSLAVNQFLASPIPNLFNPIQQENISQKASQDINMLSEQQVAAHQEIKKKAALQRGIRKVLVDDPKLENPTLYNYLIKLPNELKKYSACDDVLIFTEDDQHIYFSKKMDSVAFETKSNTITFCSFTRYPDDNSLIICNALLALDLGEGIVQTVCSFNPKIPEITTEQCEMRVYLTLADNLEPAAIAAAVNTLNKQYNTCRQFIMQSAEEQCQLSAALQARINALPLVSPRQRSSGSPKDSSKNPAKLTKKLSSLSSFNSVLFSSQKSPRNSPRTSGSSSSSGELGGEDPSKKNPKPNLFNTTIPPLALNQSTVISPRAGSELKPSITPGR